MTDAEQIYREYRAQLLSFVRKRVDSLPAAEDILQDVFLKLLNEALQQSEIQEIPLKQVAQAQGISLPGAKSRIQRGRRKLKALLLDCCRVEVANSGQVLGFEARSKCC